MFLLSKKKKNHSNSKGSCGDSIIVSGHSCDRRNPVLHFLCEGGNLTNFIVCGKVVIELHAPYRPQSMRFWLSFHGKSCHNGPIS